jgi:hypothetical protein
LSTFAAYYRRVADAHVAAAVADRVERVIQRVAYLPRTAPRVVERANVRVVLVLRYP